MARSRKPPEPKGIPSLRAFVDSLQSAEHGEFAVLASARVANEDAFAEMKSHILGLYEKVEAPRSFVDETGAIFDCIPVEQQPALRGLREPVPKAPDLPSLEAADAPPKTAAARGEQAEWQDTLTSSPLRPDRKDWHGNAMHCPEGTIPMRRVTLEDMTRFPTLRAFMRKGPEGAGRPPRSVEPPTVPATHRWAHAYQNVNNGGGHSFLNMWRPAIGANQIFSLSQHWYVGGSGANLQTIECGWQVYPGLYGDAQPHLFTYWTADDYTSTGCYNLSCGAFVQISSSFAPGMVVGPISVTGGPQYSMELAYWHTGGRWWLYYNGTQGSNAIGYYPDTLYGGGALAGHATEIDYGGETVGTTSFPPMGSGAFANQGWQHAAYQRNIGYWPPPGGAMINANLSPSQAWPGCYTAQVTFYAPPWSETLWYGGPGGTC
jgi:Neprosin/Neprosin activation peptide